MIKIIEGYGFEQDRFCYTLYETGVREKKDFQTRKATGQKVEYADVIGYYGDMNAMLNACLKHATMRAAETKNIENIHGYLFAMKEIQEKISAFMNNA